MARKKTAPEGASVDNTAPDEGVSVPRLKMGETGFAALKTRSGKMLEESNQNFRYPALLKVVAEMEASPPVAIALGAINTLMNRAEVTVEPVTGETEQDRTRREFLLSVLHDMENSWQSTMQSISSYKQYGHCVQEMVFRRRLPKNGSKWDDGLVGLKGLKCRPQNSIAKWNFSEDGRTLVSLSQSLTNVENSYRFQNLTDENGFIVIPREKFLLFRADAQNDNPEGVSCLKPCYLAYKQLTLLLDHLMTGVSKDTSGIPFAQLPPKYMDANASPEDKAVYTGTQTILNNVADGVSKGIIFPRMVDPESKTDLFSFSLLEQKSGKAYDLPAIIRLLQANILSVLSCDAITMGSDKGGSLSLQDGSTNLLALQVAYRLSEVANTLNQELVPALWRMNGWSCERLPKVAFKDVSSVSIEEFTKGIQRLASTSMLEVSRPVLNKIYEVMGFPQRPDDEPVDVANLPATLTGQSSKSGSGMEVGTSGKGTAKNGVDNGQNPSDNNADNNA
jgi:hypothetical protein